MGSHGGSRASSSRASSSSDGGGQALFNKIAPESEKGRIDTSDVVQRLEVYGRYATTSDEKMSIYKTELPEMYDTFSKNKAEYNNLFNIVMSGKATSDQRARYYEADSRRATLSKYIRWGESHLRDNGERSLAEKLEKQRKEKGISNRDLY